MSGTSILVIVSCLIEAGGFGKVWEINRQDGRFEVFNFPVDPTTRTTFLSVVIGTFWSTLSIYGISQTAVQRFLSARSVKDAKWSMWLNVPFSTIVIGAATLQGVVLYAFYHTKTDVVSPTMYCDEDCTSPLEQPVTYVNQPPNFTSPDQIVMIFVNQQFSHIPGYQGIFISCIFAGALSTISSGINSMVAVTIEDIWKPLRKWLKDHHQIQLHDNDARDTKISKILSVLFGLLSIGLAFLASRLGTLVTIINSVLGIFGAPILGAFLVGMLWRRAVPRWL
ncbi:putative sodium-dependent multivitamin transporter isoform X1 [Apostichopus japonicus]|uniref:Putative sodium-dependent multivitamin transporter isoform X1 n=1 Tax=Stichopus japonicus TaxID=307972 RepID=A0A2G8KVW9_STIJA|nr:putative sodium-dependent multivitamin transporter isoform X1 [Apostichopus japonicus]